MALLAACAQSNTADHAAHTGIARTYGSYHRPASYDPPGPASDPWGPWIREASRRFDVPERWVRGVMRQESGGRVTATSGVGAMGLLQLMPGTYAEMASRYGLGDDPYHPYDNLMAGTAYMREMYDLYGSPAFLAAYNAGPKRLEAYLWGGRGLPAETRNYVARIGPGIIDSSPRRRAPPEVYAAADIPLRIPAGPRQMDSGTMLALREQRETQLASAAVSPVQPHQLVGTVTSMAPIPDGSTYTRPAPVTAPVELASAAPVPTMAPIPDGSTYASNDRRAAPFTAPALVTPAVATMDPIPNPPEPAPVPRREPVVSSVLAYAEPLPTPPRFAEPARAEAPRLETARAEPRRDARQQPFSSQYAALPEPPREPGGFSALGSANASVLSRAAPAAPANPRNFSMASARGSFLLIPRAQAETLPRETHSTAGGGSGAWAVQVGAFASQNLAHTAASQAQGAASGGHTYVMPVSTGRSTLYRARVTGLSRNAAEATCGRMRRGDCVVLSPESQS